MGWKKYAAWAAVGIVAVGVFKWMQNPVATSCVQIDDDRNWSFRSFYNGCKRPINVVFCNKMAVGEIAKLFGYNTGEWDCRIHYDVYPGGSITTIKWTHEESSIASHLLSTSRYTVSACNSPYKPELTSADKFSCVK